MVKTTWVKVANPAWKSLKVHYWSPRKSWNFRLFWPWQALRWNFSTNADKSCLGFFCGIVLACGVQGSVGNRYLMYAGGQCLQCRGASSVWFVNHWWHIMSSTLISGHVAPWTLEYLHMVLCIWWWKPTKAESQWPAGEDGRAALTTSGSVMSRRIPTPYCCLCCGDLRSPGIMERCNYYYYYYYY